MTNPSALKIISRYKHTSGNYAALRNQTTVDKYSAEGIAHFLHEGLTQAPEMAVEALSLDPVMYKISPEVLAYLWLSALFHAPQIHDVLQNCDAVKSYDQSKLNNPTPEVLNRAAYDLYYLLEKGLHQENPVPVGKILAQNINPILDVVGTEEAGDNLFLGPFGRGMPEELKCELDERLSQFIKERKSPRHTVKLGFSGS